MENKLFMVRTSDMKLDGFNTTMAKKLGEYFFANEAIRFRKVDIEVGIPFNKTNNTEKEEYEEMLTGTLYYKENDKFVSEDSLVSFTTSIGYDTDLFNDLCETYSLRKVRFAMKLIYHNNRKKHKKNKLELLNEEKTDKVLKKLYKKI